METKLNSLVIDDKIPYIKGVLEPYFNVKYSPGTEFKEYIEGANGLIVRTRTKCGESLLENSKVEMIATATIGFDHIDLEYCAQNNIEVTTSAGCNASAVVQYVFGVCSALKVEPSKCKVAIVGCGNVGLRVAKMAKKLGFEIFCTDAPIKDSSNSAQFPFELYPIEEALKEADVVTIHLPLNRTGEYKTEGLFDQNLLSKIKNGAFLINSSRGEVLDEEALICALDNGNISGAAIDVWCGEPLINSTLLEKATYATTHIAGYSKNGKKRATEMVVRSIANHFGIDSLKDWSLNIDEPSSENLDWETLTANIKDYFDIEQESSFLKENRDKFEQIRSDYPLRREFF